MASPPIRGRRGKSFLDEEDVALCITWMTITQDPVIGIRQPMSKFWDRVMAKFWRPMLELTPHGLYVQSKIDGIESDIIVQNGMGYSHGSQIGRKVELTSPTRSVVFCYNFPQQIY